MPISADNLKRYPKNWKEISLRIRTVRSGGRCECDGRCGHDHEAETLIYDGDPKRCTAMNGQPHPITQSKVVLTVMHLDHMPENCDDENLMAGCQRCHNAYDRPHRNANSARTRATKKHKAQVTAGQLALFLPTQPTLIAVAKKRPAQPTSYEFEGGS